MISRRLNWLSSVNDNNREKILALEKKLAAFYKSNPNYYSSIDFTSENWIHSNEVGYNDIVISAKKSKKILEVGCGSANILKHHKSLEEKYYGCDFSDQLVKLNSEKYPLANFISFTKPNILPYEDGAFDLVFSVFVLEHSTNPAIFLRECMRVLKANGILIILCPDFLGNGRMSSQRAGFSEGTSKHKFLKGRYLDALITLFDNRIRIPLYCKYIKYKSNNSCSFYINASPTVFTDNFIPDVDAVYLTNKNEIIHFLKNLTLIKNDREIIEYENTKRIIYLKFIK